MAHKVSIKDKATALGLAVQGLPQREIGKAIGTSQRTISRLVDQFRPQIEHFQAELITSGLPAAREIILSTLTLGVEFVEDCGKLKTAQARAKRYGGGKALMSDCRRYSQMLCKGVAGISEAHTPSHLYQFLFQDNRGGSQAQEIDQMREFMAWKAAKDAGRLEWLEAQGAKADDKS